MTRNHPGAASDRLLQGLALLGELGRGLGRRDMQELHGLLHRLLPLLERRTATAAQGGF